MITIKTEYRTYHIDMYSKKYNFGIKLSPEYTDIKRIDIEYMNKREGFNIDEEFSELEIGNISKIKDNTREKIGEYIKYKHNSYFYKLVVWNDGKVGFYPKV